MATTTEGSEADETQDEAMIIGIAVLAALLLLLLIILLILCCCFKTIPCCGGCSACCGTELHCCCGSLFCCFCCAQWLLCCCYCCCHTHKHVSKVSPATSEVVIIPAPYSDKATNTSLVSVKDPPRPPSPPPPEVKTIEVCGKCMQELLKCICPKEPAYVIPPQPVVQPVYYHHPTPALPPPQPPCSYCYGQYYNPAHTHTYCQVCDRGSQLPAILDHNQVRLSYHDRTSSSSTRGRRKRQVLSDDTSQSREVQERAYERMLTDRHHTTLTRTSDDVQEDHGGCSTQIYLVSGDQKHPKSPETSGTERSYVYLPTDCSIKMTQQMSEDLKKSYSRVTAGK